MHKDVEMLELMKLPKGQCWPVREDTSLWGLYFGVFQKVETHLLGTLGKSI